MALNAHGNAPLMCLDGGVKNRPTAARLSIREWDCDHHKRKHLYIIFSVPVFTCRLNVYANVSVAAR